MSGGSRNFLRGCAAALSSFPSPGSFTPLWLPLATCRLSRPEQGYLGEAVMPGVWEVTLEAGARTLQEMLRRPPGLSPALESGRGPRAALNHKPLICPSAPSQPPRSCPLSQPPSSRARLQQYLNHEVPDVQAGFRKGRGTRDQISTSAGSLEKQESSRKTSISALLTMPKPLTVWITINCGKF